MEYSEVQVVLHPIACLDGINSFCLSKKGVSVYAYMDVFCFRDDSSLNVYLV